MLQYQFCQIKCLEGIFFIDLQIFIESASSGTHLFFTHYLKVPEEKTYCTHLYFFTYNINKNVKGKIYAHYKNLNTGQS